MKLLRALGLLAFTLFSFLLLVANARAWDITAMNKQIDQTNVLMNNNCSGTLIDASKGYVLTASHCVAGQFQIIERNKIDSDGKVTTEKVRIAVPGTFSYLTFKDANEVSRTVYIYKIVQFDDQTDLALVKTAATLPETQAAPVACKEPVRGDAVFAVGNPYAVLYSSVTAGIIASTDRNYPMLLIDGQGDNTLVQSSAPIAPGNSGGALYNGLGELIGVNVRGAPGITLSVPLKDIKAILDKEGLSNLWARCK